MSEKKYLAFIEPLEDITDKSEVMCQIRPVTGDLAYNVIRQVLTTGIFKYYFWGTTFEVIYVNDKGVVTKVEDLKRDTMVEFNMGVIYAITYNRETHEVLSNTGFLHNLDDSLFARHCKPVLQRMYYEIDHCSNFSMRMYTKNGAIMSINFDKDVSPVSRGYKYIMQTGFVSANKEFLRNMMPKTQADFDRNKQLTQDDIDKLVNDMLTAKD